MASLLHRGTEIVTVFPDEMIIDGEGNKKMRPSATGIVCRAVVQPITTTEDAKVGYQTMSKYRLRLVGYSGNPSLLGAQAVVEWQGRRYGIHGEPMIYNGSPRTRHVDYTMVRY